MCIFYGSLFADSSVSLYGFPIDSKWVLQVFIFDEHS